MFYVIAPTGADIMHFGKGHDDNPPGRGSGRYPWGSGKEAFQKKYGKGGSLRRIISYERKNNKKLSKTNKNKIIKATSNKYTGYEISAMLASAGYFSIKALQKSGALNTLIGNVAAGAIGGLAVTYSLSMIGATTITYRKKMNKIEESITGGNK
jgi:hypothetical protein